ncbi:DUF4333 domain-containing protein [Cellulomonas sp. JZ18]|uniref:DUF4333 domain-containing protein n=1 Tax=Cellulomonas sp. JZ18 TaxID=2654191 RepID=UPI0012D3951B|nr:DUF4333 domain-containing protein [Cellulomonas sp. JZ18]QGQ20478.1 DUF4333 domain-containing protein [Cellulomonas sp. JZ18]
MRSALPALTIAATVLLAGCSVHVDTRFVGTDEIEEKVAAALTEKAGRVPDSIECPEQVPAREGADVRCTITDGEQRIGVTVSVTGVRDGFDVSVQIDVDDEPLPAGS